MGDPTTDQLVALAWDALPAADRGALTQLGADRWEILDEPLGRAVDARMRSAGERGSQPAQIHAEDAALGIWLPELRLMLINQAHPALRSAEVPTREALLTWVAWHEWGHALSVLSLTPHDPSEGERLLSLAPAGIRERVRRSDYPRRAYLHELVAETYALLMRERVEGRRERPPWLANEIYNLMARIGTTAHREASP